ncbi:MAG: chemotaxis protein CheW [SAR324 cluster bacterium]|nr:chemotaxis protein CheW [SAR324 cluster bacterium]MBF0350972.1 chemotaxis protein CheW [SAR324 cluster bacterium]
MKHIADLEQTLHELRTSFDENLTRPLQQTISETRKMMVGQFGREKYAIDLHYIQEIIKVPHVTRIPTAPVIIEGIINLSGEIVSVSKIHSILRVSPLNDEDSKRIVITKNLRFQTGLIIDMVHGILDIEVDSIRRTSQASHTLKNDWVDGTLFWNNELVILLNLPNLLESQEAQTG